MERSFRSLVVRCALAVMLVVLGCAVLAASIWWDNAANRGIAATAPSPPIPWADVPRGGVNTYGLHHEVVTAEQRRTGDNKVARTFRMIRDGGFHWVRVQFPWEDIEFCGKGDFIDCRGASAGESMWTKYDYIVEQARRYDLDLIVRLDRPPPWARRAALASPEVVAATTQGLPVVGPPDRFEDYADFVGAVAARYRDDLRFYQIWNEPNLPGEWNYRRQDPAEFVRLLRLAGEAIKANDPDAVIVFPALSPTDGADGVATNDLEYLQGVYDAGGRDAFDIMSAQFYGLGQPPDEHRYVSPNPALLNIPASLADIRKALLRPIETRADVSRVVLQREIMERNGDASKAVWVSELGWNSAPPGLAHPWGRSVSEEEKAQYLIGAMERAQREWPWMGAMCVWMFRWGGEPPDPDDPTPYFALVDFDFTSRPAYTALASYLANPPRLPLTQPNPMATVASLLGVFAVVAATAWAWSPVIAVVSHAALALVGRGAGAVRFGRGAAADASRQAGRGWAGAAPHVRRFRLDDRWIMLVMLVGLAVFYRASAQLPLTLLGAAIFVPLALLRPDLALLFVPLTVPLYLAPKGIWDARFGLSRPEGYFIPLHEVVLLSAVAGTVLHQWRVALAPRAVFAQARRFVLPGLWLIAGTVGVAVVVEHRGAALREWRWLIVEPLMFYGLVLWYGRTASWRWRLVAMWLLTGVAVALVGIFQVGGLNLAPIIARQTCSSADVVSAEGVRRATSVYCHPNNLGLALGRAWPVLAAFALLGTAAPAKFRRMSWLPRPLERLAGGASALVERRLSLALVPAALAAVVLAGIAASFSRGAIVGGVAAVVVLGIALRRRALLWLAGVVCALGIVVVLIAGVERFNPLGGSSTARLELWGSALAMLRDHPLTGVGLDQFYQLRNATPEGGRYITPQAAASSERYAAHPHNAILDVLLRTGPFGLLVMVLLVARFYRTSARLLPTVGSPSRALVAGLLAAMTGAFVHGLLDNFYFVPDLAMAFWLMVGLMELLADTRPVMASPANDQPDADAFLVELLAHEHPDVPVVGGKPS